MKQISVVSNPLFLFSGFLLCLFSCSGKAIRSGDEHLVSAAEIAEQAYYLFEDSIRTRDSVLQALKMAKRSFETHRTRDSVRFSYAILAARCGIWLSYYSDEAKDQSEFANKAMSFAEKAVNLNNSRVEGFYYRAISLGLFADKNRLVGRNAMMQIRRDLEIAIEFDQTLDYGGPYRVLGALYLRAPGAPAGIGSKRRALYYLEEAYKIAPDFPENLIFLAEAYIENDFPEKAATVIAKAETRISDFGDETDRRDWRKRLENLQNRAVIPN